MSRKAILNTITSILTALGSNAIPAGGVFISGWAAETAVLLYLMENVISLLLAVLRVQLLAPVGEDVPGGKLLKRTELLNGYLLIGLGFSVASAVFILGFLFLIPATKVDVQWQAIQWGLAGILAFQLFGFIWDLFLLRPLSLARGESLLKASLGRINLLYLAVFMGMCVAFFEGRWFLGPFIVFKTIVDVGSPIQFFWGRRKQVLGVEQPGESSSLV
jgi:hypothetical protein